MNPMLQPWKTQLFDNLASYIRKARKDGITSMTFENVAQCVRFPQSGGPVGVNARWQAMQILRELCDRFPSFVTRFDS